MKRSLALLPVLVLTGVGCSSPAQRTATYSTGDEVPHSPYSYTGGPRKTGSSTRGLRSAAPVASAAPAPTYSPPAPTRTYTPPPTTAYVTPPPPPAPSPAPTSAPAYTPPPATAYVPPPPPPTPAPVAAPPPMAPSSGPFIWARSLNEAQALARSQGKLIFLETGRDACGNCQRLKNQTIPEMSTELGGLSVGYYDDCDRDPNSQAFNILFRNLPGAGSLPLVGWVTPDLRWVHGFSGGRDSSRFRQELQTARATWRQMAAIDRPRPAQDLARIPATPPVSEAELADVRGGGLGEVTAERPAVEGASTPAPVTVAKGGTTPSAR